ncbi:hypothetical protein QTN47_13110 [Danxiaibacter flavus]|uniref:Surface carbohydrate biosynthesis protein n=1 Tax=Danxiaibacter flavus TaxID=3049108 RepID=A0ABV3ZEY8_9BACT|nr:hypothetical protein QNM32_13115 [Chitinophagaceae bacterium DXS]
MKTKAYLLEYIRQHDSEYNRRVDLLKIELDHFIYSYGDHFKNPKEGRKPSTIDLHKMLYKLYTYYSVFFKNVNFDKLGGANVLSLVYFKNFSEELKSEGYNAYSPIWTPVGKNVIGNLDLTKHVWRLNKQFKTANFNKLLSESFSKAIQNFEEDTFAFIKEKKLKSLFLFTNQLFYSKIAINVFKRLGRPSFVLSHGMPGVYLPEDESRTDYLLVWGDKIRENYIEAGVDAKKIYVSGHPSYTNYKRSLQCKFAFDDILVVCKSASLHQHTYSPVLTDRGNLILYLLQIKNVLVSLGVKKVRVRPHPTMNALWFESLLGSDFFVLDIDPLPDSLKRSSLVIGPGSTLLLEAQLFGTNYLVYEPNLDKLDLAGGPIARPFDGSDKNIPVARNETDLRHMLQQKERNNPAFLEDYLSPLNLSFVKSLIG